MSELGQIPWWEQFQREAERRSDDTEINQQRFLSIAATAALDRVARTGLGTMICSAILPMLLGKGSLKREVERLEFYGQFADAADVSATFLRPPKVDVIEEYPTPLSLRHHFSPKGAESVYLSFRTPYETLNPEMAETWARHKHNRTARALHLRHHDHPRPTILFIHGQSLENYRINNLWFSLTELYQQGYDILQITLPFHGERGDRTQLVSGMGFYSNGLAGTNEAMLQAIFEARIWIDYLFASGAPKVGVSGVSLGGYLSALLACVDERLSFAIPNSPVVAPVDMALEWQPVAPMSKLLFKLGKFSINEMRHHTALHSPLTYQPLIAPERLFIISGAGDRFTSPRFVRLLHKHWPGSRIHWFPGNHLLHLQQTHYLQDMHAFIERCFKD